MTATLTEPRQVRPRSKSPLPAVRHGWTMAWRNLVKLRLAPQLVLMSAVQQIVMLLVFLLIFGGAVSGDRGEYLSFLLPGILAQNLAFQISSAAIAIQNDIRKGIFDRFRSLPIARSAPLVGHIIGDVPRLALANIVVVLAAVAFGFRIHTGPLEVLLAFALVMVMAVAFSWVAATVGLFAKRPESVSMAGLLLMLPLAFGSNALVPTTSLPGWFQSWVRLNPLTYLSDALRSLLTGPVESRPVLLTLLSAAVVTLIFMPLAIRAYARRL
jgi:oleandomycin transport system permease protein